MDGERVGQYFTDRLGTPFRVTSIHQTFPGMSRETWLVAGEIGKAAEHKELVLRINPPSGGGVPVPMKVEYEVYKRLFSSPVPVAEPLWYDEDIDFADGRAHMVRDMVEGTTEVAGLHDPGPEGEAMRERTCKEHAEKLALVHTLDWESYGFSEIFPTPASPAQAMRTEFETWKAHFKAGKTDPFPIVTEALYWLEENLPTDSPRISLIKGNNGVGEEIWRDGKIVAMSDWELAALGDGCLDWGFCQGMLDLWDREKTLAHYEAAAGYTVSRQTLAFCELWITFKAITCLNSTLGAYLDGRDLRPTISNMGLGTVKIMEHMLGEAMGMDDMEQALEVVKGRRSSPYHPD